jgi:hypothetical protein
MRSVVVAILLGAAACHGATQSGPAWPAPSTTAEDGGESIAPHEASVTAAVEKSPDADKDDDKPAAEEVKPAAVDDDTPETPLVAPTAPPDDDPIITDEIIIEIED